MSSGTLWILLLVAGPLLMVLMHRGHGGHGGHGGQSGHGSHGGGQGGSPEPAPAGPRTKVDNEAGHAAGEGDSGQESGGHRHRGGC